MRSRRGKANTGKETRDDQTSLLTVGLPERNPIQAGICIQKGTPEDCAVFWGVSFLRMAMRRTASKEYRRTNEKSEPHHII